MLRTVMSAAAGCKAIRAPHNALAGWSRARCWGMGQGVHRLFEEDSAAVLLGTMDNKDIIVLLGHRWVTGRLGLTVYVQY
jgi:hypothetical protein